MTQMNVVIHGIREYGLVKVKCFSSVLNTTKAFKCVMKVSCHNSTCYYIIII